jgi:hypothetical protein
VKKLLMNCDQVFEVLTRGPFPTGEPGDIAVEHHLRACHECRQLAEALRPAVALLHEAVEPEQAMDLPEYQGSLPWKRPQKRRLAISRLATVPPPVANEPRVLSRKPLVERRPPQTISAGRFIAMSLLIALVGLIIGTSAIAPARRHDATSKLLVATADHDLADGMPSEKGLLTLAALKLPVSCMPLTHRPLSAEHAAEVAAALSNGTLDALHCCTECHHAGAAQPRITHIAAIAQQNCQACHRG